MSCTGGTAAEVAPVDAGPRWRLPLNGPSEYRWTNPPPRLSIVRANLEVMVRWPSPADGFVLESTTHLEPPAVWDAVAGPPVNTNGWCSVVLLSSGLRQFHRLRQ